MSVKKVLSLLILISSTVCAATTYDLSAKVFVSRTTADAYHVGDDACYSTSKSVDCFPDGPTKDYRLEFPNGTFATARQIDGEDALRQILESKGKSIEVRFRLMAKDANRSQPYSIAVPFYAVTDRGKPFELESHYRVYPDAKR